MEMAGVRPMRSLDPGNSPLAMPACQTGWESQSRFLSLLSSTTALIVDFSASKHVDYNICMYISVANNYYFCDK
jgi:hypothetical protein